MDTDTMARQPLACKVCGTMFTPEYGDKRRMFCTKQCSTKYGRRMIGRHHRHRARYHGVEYEPIRVYEVFERDGWKCQMCGRKTPKQLRGTFKPNAPELDHRIPMAMGGGHLWDNVQCACRECNGRKGGRSAVGQMPLFINGL